MEMIEDLEQLQLDIAVYCVVYIIRNLEDFDVFTSMTYACI